MKTGAAVGGSTQWVCTQLRRWPVSGWWVIHVFEFQMFEDTLNIVWRGDEGDDLHPTTALGAEQWVSVPDLFNQLSPA